MSDQAKKWIGRVKENFRLQCEIIPQDHGPGGLAFFRSNLSDSDDLEDSKPAVGDLVEYRITNDRQLVIEKILERKNVLARQVAGLRYRKKQIIASNLDGILICQSLHKPVANSGFLDRLFVFAESQNLEPILLWTKLDLLSEMTSTDQNVWLDLFSCYENIPYKSFTLSLKIKNFSIDIMGKQFTNQLSSFEKMLSTGRWVIIGNSGVGKSTLIRHLTEDNSISIAEVNEKIGKGKHTTTRAVLYKVLAGGEIIDTAGVREFGLSGIEQEKLADYFPEFETWKGDCRIPNCTHLHEPNCRILEAHAQGKIEASRYRSYSNIFNSLIEIPDWKRKKGRKR